MKKPKHQDIEINKSLAAGYAQKAASYSKTKTCWRLQTVDRLGLFIVLVGVVFPGTVYSQEMDAVLERLQKRYASVHTVSADFRQNYRAPGIDQTESGTFWLKRPGFMRWEYRHPEEKLFLTDGREAFLYVPEERQVTVQPFTMDEMRRTPLRFLLGSADIQTGFTAAFGMEYQPAFEDTLLIRLAPQAGDAEYSFLLLELDRETCDIRRIVIHEQSGNTSEFVFVNLLFNVKVDDSKFRFRIPKGIEVIRLENSE